MSKKSLRMSESLWVQQTVNEPVRKSLCISESHWACQKISEHIRKSPNTTESHWARQKVTVNVRKSLRMSESLRNNSKSLLTWWGKQSRRRSWGAPGDSRWTPASPRSGRTPGTRIQGTYILEKNRNKNILNNSPFLTAPNSTIYCIFAFLANCHTISVMLL